MRGTETRYPLTEKLGFALIVAARKLKPYFEAHPIERRLEALANALSLSKCFKGRTHQDIVEDGFSVAGGLREGQRGLPRSWNAYDDDGFSLAGRLREGQRGLQRSWSIN
ncbi:hypothetical protein LIER_01874 [Lithospermum erythrorhizon]|uniref:Reverse transcriptase RNase H-like domain-containing protein n=1 Tax=Lithospermum erythrorhizon TaxID=34254 RepID=A0AAV3NS18_LITER